MRTFESTQPINLSVVKSALKFMQLIFLRVNHI